MPTPGLLAAPPLPSEGLDLAALHRADLAIRDAAANGRAEAMEDRLAEPLAAVDAATAALARALIAELGRVEARAAAAAQAAEEGRRSRGEWVALDPLRASAAPMTVASSPTLPDRVDINPADPAFRGFGWHEPEGKPGSGFRWSRHSVASIILPSLGAGAIRVHLALFAPFGLPLRATEITLLHEGAPLDVTLSGEGKEQAVLQASLVSADAGGLGSLALILSGPAFPDPRGQEKRGLGLGLRRIVAERL
ncbi:hypothetical protein ACE7GA_21865 [Roseomonas sp. CCTCC AB2023176]|uniref:hypothetical protein n=1 Tax=Roseomonas sp. CCTCC AB2023176 TaxID=3342640 RepID=UPI0035DB581E